MVKFQGLTVGVICFVLFFSIFAFAQEKTSAVDISTVGIGARPIALGGAYTALADDASAVFTNPGGIGLQNRISFVSMSTQLLTCVDYQVVSAVYPTEYGVFGAGYIGVNAPAGYHTYYDSTGASVEGGAINYSQSMYVLSYGRGISDKIGAGANLKFMSQGLSGSLRNAPNASGYSLDLGVLYQVDERLTVGATLQNAMSSVSWSTGNEERLQQTLKIGTGYRVLENVQVLGDMGLVDGEKAGVAAGVEWQAVKELTLRAGVAEKDQSIDDDTTAVMINYTAGIGLTLGDFRFDYSYKLDPNFSELSTHYFSFCFFNGEEPAKRSEEKSIAVKVPEQEQVKGEAVTVSDGNDKRGKSDTYAKKNSSKGTVLDQYMELIEEDSNKVSQAQ